MPHCIDGTGDTTVPGANGSDATLVADTNELVSCTFTNVLDGTLVPAPAEDRAELERALAAARSTCSSTCRTS